MLKTPDEARTRAKAILAMGADVLGVQDGDAPPEVFAAYADEGHKAGKGVMMRCVGPQTRAKSCVLAGADVMLHTGLVGVEMNKDPEKWKDYVGLPPDVYCDMDPAKEKDMVAFLVAHNTALVPNLIAADRGFASSWKRVQQEDRDVFDDPNLRAYYPEYAVQDLLDNVKSPEEYLTPDQISIRSCGYKNHAKFIGDLIAAGGHALASMDDTQSAPGLGVLQEMAVFQEDAHVPPMKIIQSATKWPAEHYHLKDLGTIEAGKLADIDIVTADPTADIMNMRKLDTVIKDGKVIDRAYHAWYHGWYVRQRQGQLRSGAGQQSRLCRRDQAGDGARPGRAEALYDGHRAERQRGRNSSRRRRYPERAGTRPGSGLFTLSPTPGIETIAPRTVIAGHTRYHGDADRRQFRQTLGRLCQWRRCADDGGQRDEAALRRCRRTRLPRRKAACRGEKPAAVGDCRMGRYVPIRRISWCHSPSRPNWRAPTSHRISAVRWSRRARTTRSAPRGSASARRSAGQPRSSTR